MKQAHSLQRQHRRYGSSAIPAVAFAEPTHLFAPVAVLSAPTFPHERQQQPAYVAQFRHSFDRFSIHSPVPDTGAGHEVEQPGEQPDTQQIETQPSSVQRKQAQRPPTSQTGESLQRATATSQVQGNHTGLPDALKAGVENLSGKSLDAVRTHFNSAKPAQVGALAYTQGTEIYVGPGQEEHLPHETWHVVQQMQGRVRPTLQMKGVAINDDEELEREADVMGERSSNRSEPQMPDGEVSNEMEQSEGQFAMQQTEKQPASVQRKEAQRQPTSQNGSGYVDVIQRRNGAYPINFHITNAAANDAQCDITTGVDWESSTGDRNDLSDIAFREEVTFSQDPRVNVPGYDALLAMDRQFQLAGTVLTKEGAPMSSPGGSDTHSGAAYGPSFTINGVPNLQKGNWTLVGSQFYQYRDTGLNGAWRNLHQQPFTITRTMQLVDNRYELTLRKQGPGVDLTAGPTRINFETTAAMETLLGDRPDQTEDWDTKRGQLTGQNLIFQNLDAGSTRLINGTNVTFEYDFTAPSADFPGRLRETVLLPDNWRRTILAEAQSAANIITEQVLTGLASPPTRFKITIFRASGVQQQSFWTHEAGVPTYRVILRADKIMDRKQWGEQSISGRESERVWLPEKDKIKWIGKSTVVQKLLNMLVEKYRIRPMGKGVTIHELGHMLHAFANPGMYMNATRMPSENERVSSNDPLRQEKLYVAYINNLVIAALKKQDYKYKWTYALGNPGEVVAEVFTALMHGRNVPRGLAAVYVAYGGVRSATIDKGLQRSFGGPIPSINQPEAAIPIINGR